MTNCSGCGATMSSPAEMETTNLKEEKVTVSSQVAMAMTSFGEAQKMIFTWVAQEQIFSY
jgi:hypothetical protein